MSPQSIAQLLLRRPEIREVVVVQIVEDLDGWSVRARVKLIDNRRRQIGFAEHGDSRDAAIETFFDQLNNWLQIHIPTR